MRLYLTVGADPEGPNGPVRGPMGGVVFYTSMEEAGDAARALAKGSRVPVFVQQMHPVAVYHPLEGTELEVGEPPAEEAGDVSN